MKARRRPSAIALVFAAVLVFALLVAGTATAVKSPSAAFGGDDATEPVSPPASGSRGVGVFALAPEPGGRLLAAIGNLGHAGYFAAARFSPAGQLDTGFGDGGYTAPLHLHGYGQLHAMSVAPGGGGRALLAGYDYERGGRNAQLLVRFRSDGTLDPTFGGDDGIVAPKPASEGTSEDEPGRGGGALFDIAIGSRGRIIGVGAQNAFGGPPPAGLVIAYRPDGSLDPTFGDRGRVVIAQKREGTFTGLTAVRTLADGGILVAGYLHGQLSVLRLTADGRRDPSFGGGDGLVDLTSGRQGYCCSEEARLAPGGRILVAGVAQGRPAGDVQILARLLPDGRRDSSFGSQGLVVGTQGRPGIQFFSSQGLAVDGQGRVVVSGYNEIDSPDLTRDVFTALRYRADGRVDRSFGTNGVLVLEPEQEGLGLAATTTASGRVVVGGGVYLRPPGEPQENEPEPYEPFLARLR